MRPPGTLPPTIGKGSHLSQLRKAHVPGFSKRERERLQQWLSQTEHFVFTALPPTTDEELVASAEAMGEAGVWHLPFPICTFEFSASIKVQGVHPYDHANRFIIVAKEDADGPNVHGMFIRARREAWLSLPLKTGENGVSGPIDTIGPDIPVEIDLGGYEDAGAFCGACLVLLATRGIPRERWHGDRPLLRGRPEPRDAYTKVMVREAYDRQVTTGDAEPHDGGPRYRVRLHLRRGHIRHQPIGPRSLGQSRMIWIAPMLVGYAEEGTIEHTHYERRPRHFDEEQPEA